MPKDKLINTYIDSCNKTTIESECKIVPSSRKSILKSLYYLNGSESRVESITTMDNATVIEEIISEKTKFFNSNDSGGRKKSKKSKKFKKNKNKKSHKKRK